MSSYNCDKIFYYKVNSRINFLNLGGLVFKVNVDHYPIVEMVWVLRQPDI